MYEESLEKITSDMRAFGIPVQPACSSEQLDLLRARAIVELGQPILDEFAQFLSVTDGLVWNGLMVYAHQTTQLAKGRIDGFIEANTAYRRLRWRDPMESYFLFAEDSIAFYTYDRKQAAFNVLTIVGMTVLESYASFDELLADALRSHV
jgi:hypothetical protein